MKKLVSLIMALALVLGLATVAFADTPATVLDVTGDSSNGWSTHYDAPGSYSVTLPAGCTSVSVDFWGMPGSIMGNSVEVSSLTSGGGVNNDYSIDAGGMMPVTPDMGGNASFELGMMNWGNFALIGEPGDVFTFSIVAPPVGTFGFMDDIKIDDLWYGGNANSQIMQMGENVFEFTVTPPADDTYYGEYYYGVTAENSYYMTISDVEAVVLPGQEVANSDLKWSVSLNTMYGLADVTSEEPDETAATTGFEAYGYYALAVSAGQYDKTTGELVGPAAIKFTLTYDDPEIFSELNPKHVEILEMPDFFQTVSIPASELVEDNYYGLEYYYYDLYNSESWGAQITIADPNAVVKYNGEIYTAADDSDDNDQILHVKLPYDMDLFSIGIANLNEAEKRFVVNVDLLDGYVFNPADLSLGENKISFDSDWGGYYNEYYFYTWTAKEDGTFAIDDLKAVLPEEFVDAYPEDAEPVADAFLYLNLDVDKAYNDPDYEVPIIEGNSVEVKKDDVVTVYLSIAYDDELWECPAADVSFVAKFLPANPIVVNAATDLAGIELGAGETAYYAINGKLNGQILTINGDENTVVVLNDQELTAVNGVFTAELTGTPVNALIVTNNGAAAATYAASIAFAEGSAGNPISVTTEQGLAGVKVEAGAEINYLVNSKLDGAVLTVTGEGAYVIVDGVKTEAKDGVVTVTLKATKATIALAIGNAGTAAASVAITYADNPSTGDISLVAPIAAVLMSAMGTVALVIKKKEF